MKSQVHSMKYHEELVQGKRGLRTIKYYSQVNKGHSYKNKKDKRWLETIDAQSATTQKPTVPASQESLPELTVKSEDTEKTIDATSALKK